MNAIFASLLLAALAAGASHAGVRYASRRLRWVWLGMALLMLLWSFELGRAFGGYWVSVYTILTAYFMACIVTPWLDLAVRTLGGRVQEEGGGAG